MHKICTMCCFEGHVTLEKKKNRNRITPQSDFFFHLGDLKFHDSTVAFITRLDSSSLGFFPKQQSKYKIAYNKIYKYIWQKCKIRGWKERALMHSRMTVLTFLAQTTYLLLIIPGLNPQFNHTHCYSVSCWFACSIS